MLKGDRSYDAFYLDIPLKPHATMVGPLGHDRLWGFVADLLLRSRAWLEEVCHCRCDLERICLFLSLLKQGLPQP